MLAESFEGNVGVAIAIASWSTDPGVNKACAGRAMGVASWTIALLQRSFGGGWSDLCEDSEWGLRFGSEPFCTHGPGRALGTVRPSGGWTARGIQRVLRALIISARITSHFTHFFVLLTLLDLLIKFESINA